ncbi:LCP family protein [Streptococcaceae bacterium ESL0729]|nr:LCP family protein [Streptococcaceae bacterium ESL0729]
MMDKKFKRRREYLERNYKYLNQNEKIELERLKRIEGLEEVSFDGNSFDGASFSEEENLEDTSQKIFRKDRPQAFYQDDYDEDQEDDNSDFRPVKKVKQAKKKVKVKRKRSLGKTIRNLLLIIILLMIAFFAYGYFKVKSTPAGNFTVEEFNGTKTQNGAINILILGTDQRDYQSMGDARSDSMMVLQIGAPDKKVKLVSFMRDTLVNIPGYSPEGWEDSKLNLAFNLGEQEGNKGAELVRATLKENYGLDIQYYAMVNFTSFAEVIDSLFPGGVKIDAQFSTVGGEQVSEVSVPDDLNWTPEHQDPVQIIKVGNQKMDGRTLLNYARFRKDDEGDYGRTKRQQQVLSAILSQAKNPMTLFTGASAIGTIKALTSTDVPDSLIVTKALPTLLHAKNGIESFTVPELGDWVDVMDKYGGAAIEVDFDKYKLKLDNTLGN